MFGFIIIRKKKLSEDMAVNCVESYDAGYEAGRRDAVFDKFSPNQIRAAFGLDPFPVESKEWKRINQLFEEATAMRKDVQKIDMLIDVSCCYKAFAKGMKRLSVLIEVFSINAKGIGVNNNSRRYHQKPMYRKRAYFKALKNRR